MKRLACLVTLVMSGAFVASSSAAVPSDLVALGYTVSAATQCNVPGGNVWKDVLYVSGFGIGTYLSECDADFQQSLDSIVATHCDRKWQFEHPDQVDPWSEIARLGWTETADKCADVFTITNPNDATVRYSGPGAGLVALAASIGAPPVPLPPPPPPAPPAPVTPPVVAPPVPPAAPAPPVVVPSPPPVAPPAAPSPPPAPEPPATTPSPPEPATPAPAPEPATPVTPPAPEPSAPVTDPVITPAPVAAKPTAKKAKKKPPAKKPTPKRKGKR